MAHRLGHALSRGGGMRGQGVVAQEWKEFAKRLREIVDDILKDVYGIDTHRTGSYYDGQDALRKEKILKYVAQQLGTMKSARDNKLRNWDEFAHELLAQYLITGKITLRPLPDAIVTGI